MKIDKLIIKSEKWKIKYRKHHSWDGQHPYKQQTKHEDNESQKGVENTKNGQTSSLYTNVAPQLLSENHTRFSNR